MKENVSYLSGSQTVFATDLSRMNFCRWVNFWRSISFNSLRTFLFVLILFSIPQFSWWKSSFPSVVFALSFLMGCFLTCFNIVPDQNKKIGWWLQWNYSEFIDSVQKIFDVTFRIKNVTLKKRHKKTSLASQIYLSSN